MVLGSRHYNTPLKPGSLTHVIANSKGYAVKPSLFIQCNSSTLPALPISPEVPAALHPSISSVALVLPSLADIKEIVALGTSQCLTFILLVSHTLCVGIEVFQMCSKIKSNLQPNTTSSTMALVVSPVIYWVSPGMVTRLPPCAMPDPLFSEEIPLHLQPEPLGAALVCDLLSCHCLPGRRDRPPAGYRLLKGRWRGW